MGVDVHACRGQRLTSVSSSIAPHLWFWGRVSHFNWNLSVWPAWQGESSGSSFVFVPSCGIRHTSCCICPFVWGLGTRAFVLMFMWQVLYQLSNLQILQNFLLIPLINACSLMTPLHGESDGDIWHTRRLILFTSKYPSLTCEFLIRLLEMLVRTPGMLIPLLKLCKWQPNVTQHMPCSTRCNLDIAVGIKLSVAKSFEINHRQHMFRCFIEKDSETFTVHFYLRNFMCTLVYRHINYIYNQVTTDNKP